MDKKEELPMSHPLKEFIDSNPGFKSSLRIYVPDKYIVLHAIYTSHVEHIPEDEVIGLLYVDVSNVVNNRQPIVKQDFIINHGDGSFTHYTGLRGKDARSKTVRHISEFLNKYGKNTYYGTADSKNGCHHINSLTELETSIREEAESVIASIR